MKQFLSVLLFLLSFEAAADVTGCAGYYASKLHDIFSGVAPGFAQGQVLSFGSSTEDDYFTVFVDDLKDSFQVSITSHAEETPLLLEETILHPMVSFFSTENLKERYSYPSPVPGEESGEVYLTVMCVR